MRRRHLPAAIRTRQPSADPEVVAAVDAVVAAYMAAAEEVVDLGRVDDVLVPVVHSWTLLAGGDSDFLNRACEAERLLAAASAGPGAAGMTVGEPFWSSPPGELASAPAVARRRRGRPGVSRLRRRRGVAADLHVRGSGPVTVPVGGGRSVLRPTAGGRPKPGRRGSAAVLRRPHRGYQVHVAWPGSPPAVTSLEAGPALNQEAVVGRS